MDKEWKWSSKSGKSYFHAGFGVQDAVGAEKPSDAIPLQEGARLLFAKGIDRIWAVMLVTAFIRLLGRKHRRKKHR
jgi:hypothetical protein